MTSRRSVGYWIAGLILAIVVATIALELARVQRVEALVDAAERGDYSAVQRLLAVGVPVDAVSTRRVTALQCAAEQNHADVVGLLLIRGAGNSRSTYRRAVMAAAKVGATKALIALLKGNRLYSGDKSLLGEVLCEASYYGREQELECVHAAV